MEHFLTPHQSQYFAWQLTRQAASDSVESLASALVDSQVDLNPHQVEAALFACHNPLSRGVILADEVGLGKTIEAGLVISQHWAERRRKMLIIVPANLRKQWHQELQDKFNLQGLILEAKNYNAMRKEGITQPFQHTGGPVICSYQFAKAKADDLKCIHWDLVVMDEAHRLRNVYKNGNVIARTIRDALEHVDAKVLLTATPLQNTLLELYGLVSMIDERVLHLVLDTAVVNQIRTNRSRRQIIIVTHNPNIVVNGDAELVLPMVFASGQIQQDDAGGLQERTVRERICNIMEGGRDAFRQRYKRILEDLDASV